MYTSENTTITESQKREHMVYIEVIIVDWNVRFERK